MFAILVVLCALGEAHADPQWYRGRDGKRRLLHLGGSLAAGAVYATSETVLKPTLAPDTCRLCSPSSYDRSIRDSLRWTATERAATISNLSGYLLAPVVALGSLALATDDRSWGGWIDDAIPVIEAAAVAGLLNQTVKFAVGEQRPLVHFAPSDRPPTHDDNLSFYSGHTTLAFAVATAAGEVARRRGYRAAPAIYATGYALGALTGYLRMAADRHYFTDIATGAATGIVIGLVIPALHRVDIVPTRDGLAVAGRF